MLEIECLVCGKTIEIPEFIDTDNYDGQIACRECASLLHVKLVGSKVRKYEVVERKTRSLAAPVSSLSQQAGGEEADVESIARYNRLRDFLATYRASAIQLAFEQIEGLIGSKLETAADTFKSWWDNDRSHPQAIAWLEAGWQVVDVDLQQRKVILRRQPDNV
jgi:DNA-directed RNA polymerase subunit RPC12/RpoP